MSTIGNIKIKAAWFVSHLMTTTLIQPEFPITLNEFREAQKLKRILQICIVETTCGFYVHVETKGKPSVLRYLSTRRDTDKPRKFRDLVRLNTLLRSICPKEVIKLKCVEGYKEKPKSK